MKNFPFLPLIGSFLENILSPAFFDLGIFKIEGPALLVIPAFFAVVLVLVASLVWLYRDARRRRRKSGLVAILFVLLTGYPLSFIWWFWLRPSANPAA